jgi:hypothetical protein
VFNRVAPALWILGLMSNITVAHRVYYTWLETKHLEDAQLRAVPEPHSEART